MGIESARDEKAQLAQCVSDKRERESRDFEMWRFERAIRGANSVPVQAASGVTMDNGRVAV